MGPAGRELGWTGDSGKLDAELALSTVEIQLAHEATIHCKARTKQKKISTETLPAVTQLLILGLT